MPERAYRKALVKKHIMMARIFAEKGFSQEAIERERELARFIWRQYRSLIKKVLP